MGTAGPGVGADMILVTMGGVQAHAGADTATATAIGWRA